MRVEDNDKKFGFFQIVSDPKSGIKMTSNKEVMPGRIFIQDGGEIYVEIFDSSFYHDTFRKTFNMIGLVEEWGHVTLDGCRSYGWSLNSNKPSKSNISIQKIFIGIQNENLSKMLCDYLFYFSVEWLSEWVIGGSITDLDEFKHELEKKFWCSFQIIWKNRDFISFYR